MIEKMNMQTANLADENYRALAKLFPGALTEKITGYDEEGRAIVERAIDVDVLRQEIACGIVEGQEERYRFSWPDKERAGLLANTPVAMTLRPDREKSVNFAHTKNLYIEGDNLDVLKLLRETYPGKIKLIYIDPPYNTGRDLIYADDFSMGEKEYWIRSGQLDQEGNHLVRNLESDGRYHTDWLNMMYPRLRVARALLTEDGMIMISIDENESTNLKKLCDEVFGEHNFVGEIIRKTKTMTADNHNGFNTQHEVLLIYARDKSRVRLQGEKKEFSNYANPDGDPNGDWCAGDPSAKSGGATTSFGIENPYTHRVDYPPAGRYWAFSEATLQKYIASGKVKFKETYGERERGFLFKRYKKDAVSTCDPVHSLFAIDNEFMNQAATAETKKIFGNSIFSYPKPVAFLKKLIQYATGPEDLVMDFFSGSAVTAQAVLELNAEESARRNYIMVQRPEAVEKKSAAAKAGYQTLCDIGRERILRIAEGIPSADADTGFRYLRLDSTNMKDDYYRSSKPEQLSLELYEDNVKEDRTPEDLLFQVMSELGVSLSSTIEERWIGDKKVFCVAEGYLIACFEKSVTEETIRAMAEKKPAYVVFRDCSVVTKVEPMFAAYSPETVRKIL